LIASSHSTPGASSEPLSAPLVTQPVTPVRVTTADTPVVAARPEPAPVPPVVDGGFQAMSELSEHGSNKTLGVLAGARKLSRPPAPIPTQVPAPPPESSTSSEGRQPAAAHRTKIDRANPY
jgi:hypothetical protein